MKLLLTAELLCSECGEAISSYLKERVSVMVRLLGLKAGYTLCRCGVSVKARIEGRLRYFDAPLHGQALPDADTGEHVIYCPPGAAAGALTHLEWGA